MVRNVSDVLDTAMLRALLEGRVLRSHASLDSHHAEHLLLLDGLRTVFVLRTAWRVARVSHVLFPNLSQTAKGLGFILFFLGRRTP